MICIDCKKDFISKRAKRCSSCRCKEYYRKHLQQERERKLKNYYIIKEENYKNLRETNKRATKRYKEKNAEKTKKWNIEYQKRTRQSFNRYNNLYFGGKQQLIREIYENKCAVCKKECIGTIHHIDGSGRSENINNETNNLILLCRSCHAKYHHKGELREIEFIKAHIVAPIDVI